MPSTTTAGRVRTTLALSPATHEWLREQAQGQRAMSDLIDSMVQKERLLVPVEKRMWALIEAMIEENNAG